MSDAACPGNLPSRFLDFAVWAAGAAATLLVQLDDHRPVAEARAIIRAEATALGVEWWDEK